MVTLAVSVEELAAAPAAVNVSIAIFTIGSTADAVEIAGGGEIVSST